MVAFKLRHCVSKEFILRSQFAGTKCRPCLIARLIDHVSMVMAMNCFEGSLQFCSLYVCGREAGSVLED